jgi:hypothetical protein
MTSRSQGLLVALGALSLFGVVVAWFGSSEPPRSVTSASFPAGEATMSRTVMASSPLRLAPPEARPGARAESEPGHGEREHPHPITERHRKIQHENNLRALLGEAIAARDGKRLRALAREYRVSHPDDPNRLQAGYDVLAECLANPSDAARLEAARYYDAHRSSILRRSIRRVCLES